MRIYSGCIYGGMGDDGSGKGGETTDGRSACELHPAEPIARLAPQENSTCQNGNKVWPLTPASAEVRFRLLCFGEATMHGPQRKMLLSVSVIAVLGASVPPPVAAQPSPADRAAQRATMFQNMQN